MALTYAFLHSIAFFGAVFFERLHFIKTAFVFFVSLTLLIILNKMIQGALLGRAVEAAPPFGYLRFSENGQVTDINISRDQQDHFMVYLFTALTLIFWIAAYFRVKEKQV
jgi:hypothetical protein